LKPNKPAPSKAEKKPPVNSPSSAKLPRENRRLHSVAYPAPRDKPRLGRFVGVIRLEKIDSEGLFWLNLQLKQHSDGSFFIEAKLVPKGPKK
jgi:hypothetical protein